LILVSDYKCEYITNWCLYDDEHQYDPHGLLTGTRDGLGTHYYSEVVDISDCVSKGCDYRYIDSDIYSIQIGGICYEF
jgi:hypothetical protein